MCVCVCISRICILAGVEFRINNTKPNPQGRRVKKKKKRKSAVKAMCREEIAINYMHRIFMAQLISKILTIYYIIYVYIVY